MYIAFILIVAIQALMKNYIYILAVLLCSCNKPLKITVISNITTGPNIIVFDNKDTLITNKTIDSIFLSPYKRHTFKINSTNPQEFILADKEGVLNIAKKEFIVLQTEYENEDGEGTEFGLLEINLDSYVLIDSFVVCKKAFEKELLDKTKLKTIVDSLKIRKNGNYKPPLDERFPSDVEEYDNSESVNGFKKIGNKDLFITKFWDYNFGDSIPDKISIRVRKSNKNYRNNVKKTFITLADDFLLFAKKSNKSYYMVDVRNLLKDKN